MTSRSFALDRGQDSALAFGETVIEFVCDDPVASTWIAEFMQPWFTPTSGAAAWRVRVNVSSKRYRETRRRCAGAGDPHACFAVDRHMVVLPGWKLADTVVIADDERPCMLLWKGRDIEMICDPASRRWRFTLMRVLREIGATRLRQSRLDLHAAAVEANGQALLISGAKRAGKTTLTIHLLRSGECRLIANERVFVGDAAGFGALGVPGAIKIRTDTLRRFPELRRGLPNLAMPYLHTMQELDGADGSEGPCSDELALTAAQLSRQVGAQMIAEAPLGAIVFPEICEDVETWLVERLAPEAAGTALWANRYGVQAENRARTIFEETDGAQGLPSASTAMAIAESVPAFRLKLGLRAYEAADSAARLVASLGAA